jgi:hypothetical protein
MSSRPINAAAAAEFLVRHLYRPIDLATDKRFFSVTETEQPFGGDNWFWTDDNAKVLEFLVRPELSQRYAHEAEEIFKFLRLMCRAPFIFRRVSTPRLELVGQQGTAASYYHSLMHLRYDLPKGYLIAGIRFHDNRTADNLLLCANCVDFTYHGRQYSVNVEDAIDTVEVDAAQNGHGLILQHSGDLHFKPHWRPIRLGRINYTYTIDARSMLINVAVTLDVDAAANVRDIVLTIGHDHLSHGSTGVTYSSIFTDGPGSKTSLFTAAEPSRAVLPAPGITYYSIAQTEIVGFALAVHSAPREPARLSSVETLVREPGKLHMARARYRFNGLCRGARLAVVEDKMLTAGGFYHRCSDYANLVRSAVFVKSSQEACFDYSLSYDYGAELNAFANYFAALSSWSGGTQVQVREEIRCLFDLYLNTYFDLFIDRHSHQQYTVFSRQLAFVVLGVITMYRVTGTEAYLHRVAQLCEVMLDFEKRFDDVAGAPVSGFMMGAQSQRIVFVDCHSAALLALTEAAKFIEDSRLAAVIDRGLGCYCIETTKIDWHDGPHKIDSIAVDWVDDHGTRLTNHGYWNYHAGLTLRFFAALRKAVHPALQAIAARHRERIELLEMIMRWHIERSLSWRGDAVEIRSSVLSTETNSETQPWATLGLLETGLLVSRLD